MSDLNDLCLDGTFTAEEVLQIITDFVNQEFESKKKRTRILKELNQELIEVAWFSKLSQISEELKACHQQDAGARSLNDIMADLYDIVAFLQMLAGLAPCGDRPIKRNFIAAFNLLAQVIRNVNFPQTPASDLMQQKRAKFLTICFQTLAEILNTNLPYFENPTILNECLQSIIQLDTAGKFATYFVRPLRDYYDRLQVETFKIRLSVNQMIPAIMASIRLGEDITDAVDQIPDDLRKFQYLAAHRRDHEIFQPLAIRCAEKNEDLEVIMQALKLFFANGQSAPPSILKRFYQKLGVTLSQWINDLISVREPLTEPKVRKSYHMLNKMFQFIDSDTRIRVLKTVQESECFPALKCIANKFTTIPDSVTDRQMVEQMVHDVQTILDVIIL